MLNGAESTSRGESSRETNRDIRYRVSAFTLYNEAFGEAIKDGTSKQLSLVSEVTCNGVGGTWVC